MTVNSTTFPLANTSISNRTNRQLICPVRECERLWIPQVPNLFHWFRKYVLVDLAHIHATIFESDMPREHKDFFYLMFASIIRATSNADPVGQPASPTIQVPLRLPRSCRTHRSIRAFRVNVRR